MPLPARAVIQDNAYHDALGRKAERLGETFSAQPGEVVMPFLFSALDEEENQIIKDYVRISLMTGARKSNVIAMKWDQIDWDHQSWRIPETKNGEPVTVPLIPQAIEILECRKKWTNIRQELLSEAAVNLFIEEITSCLRLENQKPKTDLDIHNQNLKRIEKEINNLMAAIKMGIITPSTKSELERAEAERTPWTPYQASKRSLRQPYPMRQSIIEN